MLQGDKNRDNNETFSDNENEHNRLKKHKTNNDCGGGDDDEIDITNSKEKIVLELICIDPNEQLFWKVFRNIFLYRKIMSNMNTHLTTPYHSIISIQNMIQCNQLNLLRDKVIRNQYLSFVGCHPNEKRFNIILKKIRNDNDQDRLFYQHLFKNCGILQLELAHVTNYIIESNCIPAFQVLIQHYQYKPTDGNLNYIIGLDKLKFVKLLKELEQQSTLQFEDSNKIFGVKILNYLYDQKFIDNKIVSQNLNKITKDLNIGKCTLKSLIRISKLILKSNNQIDINTNIVSIESFLNSLNKQELKSILSDESNQIQSKKEMIKKLLQILYSFSNVKFPHFYYIYFNGNDDETYTDSDIGIRQSSRKTYISSFRFANKELLESNEYGFDHLIEPDILFSHCQDKEKQMKFINFITSKIKEGIYFIEPLLFFYLVIYNDDLDQIKYVANELGINDHIDSIDDECEWFITNYIRSSLVLEWLFKNYYSFFTAYIGGSLIWCFRSFELLENFEKLYQLKCKSDGNENNLIQLSPGPHIPNLSYYEENAFITYNIDIVKHFIRSGSTIYNYQFDTSKDNGYDNLFSEVRYFYDCNEIDKFQLFKSLYLNFSNSIDQLIGYLTSNEFTPFLEIFESSHLVKFIDWLYRNYQDEFKNLENILKDNYGFCLIKLKIGILNENTKKHLLEYIVLNPNESSIEYLDWILSYKDSPSIKRILLNACSFGKLKTIKYIHQNYNWLIEKSNSNGIFTTKELDELLLQSLMYDHLEISDYLFQLSFSITKKQFDEYAGHLSKLYFKNNSFNE